MPLRMPNSWPIVAPFVSKARSAGRSFAARSSRANPPPSTIRITCAAITGLVALPIANWSSGSMAREPSAVPVAPVQVPLSVITVAVIPAPPAPSLRTVWNTAAAGPATGSSRRTAKVSVGKPAGGAGDDDGLAVGDSADVVVGETATRDGVVALPQLVRANARLTQLNVATTPPRILPSRQVEAPSCTHPWRESGARRVQRSGAKDSRRIGVQGLAARGRPAGTVGRQPATGGLISCATS